MPAALLAAWSGGDEPTLGLQANISSWITGGDGVFWILRPRRASQDLQIEGGKDWCIASGTEDEGDTGECCGNLDAEMGLSTIANDGEAKIAAGWVRQGENCWGGKTWPSATPLLGGYANDYRSGASGVPIAYDAFGNDTSLESAAFFEGNTG